MEWGRVPGAGVPGGEVPGVSADFTPVRHVSTRSSLGTSCHSMSSPFLGTFFVDEIKAGKLFSNRHVSEQVGNSICEHYICTAGRSICCSLHRRKISCPQREVVHTSNELCSSEGLYQSSSCRSLICNRFCLQRR